MSRVITQIIGKCADCQFHKDDEDYGVACRKVGQWLSWRDRETPFPAWCPLPEKQKEESK